MDAYTVSDTLFKLWDWPPKIIVTGTCAASDMPLKRIQSGCVRLVTLKHQPAKFVSHLCIISCCIVRSVLYCIINTGQATQLKCKRT